MKKRILFLNIILGTLSVNVSAQTARELAMKQKIDSMKMAALSEYAIRYPSLRQGFVATDIIGGRTLTGELNGNPLYQGKMNVTRVRSNFNIPIAQWGKTVLNGTVSYQQIHAETKEIVSLDPRFSSENRILNKSTVGFTATISRSDSVFGHPISYSGSLSGLTGEFKSIQRLNYLGTVSVPVNKGQYSSLTLGAVVIVDPSAVAPVIPIISYWRKFRESDLDLYVDLPQRIILRKELTKKAWASLGSELGGNLYFYDMNQPSLPQNNVFSITDVRTGATFEYLVTKKLILGVSGGLYTAAKSRLLDHNAKPDDYFFRMSNGSTSYLTFSLSFLPFLKR